MMHAFLVLPGLYLAAIHTYLFLPIEVLISKIFGG